MQLICLNSAHEGQVYERSVQKNSNLHSVQCIAAVKIARAALFLVKRAFVNLTPAVFLPLYCTLVRPHLEYAIQATSPYLKKDIYHTERFQRLATRMVKGLHHPLTFNVCSVLTYVPFKNENGGLI